MTVNPSNEDESVYGNPIRRVSGSGTMAAENEITIFVQSATESKEAALEGGSGFTWLNDDPSGITGNTVGMREGRKSKNVYSDAELPSQIIRIFNDPVKREALAFDLYMAGHASDTRVFDTQSSFILAADNMLRAYNSDDAGILGSQNALSWLADRADESNREPPNIDGTGGGAYSGPVRTVTSSVMDDRDVEVTLNELATDMLGRNLTKKELNKYSQRFKKQDALPQVNVRTPNGPGQVTSVTQERQTRESIGQDILRSNDDYVTNTINTDVMDIMAQRLGL